VNGRAASFDEVRLTRDEVSVTESEVSTAVFVAITAPTRGDWKVLPVVVFVGPERATTSANERGLLNGAGDGLALGMSLAPAAVFVESSDPDPQTQQGHRLRQQ
jgi:hypothetical protein